jgi:hypothetical protein
MDIQNITHVKFIENQLFTLQEQGQLLCSMTPLLRQSQSPLNQKEVQS